MGSNSWSHVRTIDACIFWEPDFTQPHQHDNIGPTTIKSAVSSSMRCKMNPSQEGEERYRRKNKCAVAKKPTRRLHMHACSRAPRTTLGLKFILLRKNTIAAWRPLPSINYQYVLLLPLSN